jgi:hypothetical protein
MSADHRLKPDSQSAAGILPADQTSKILPCPRGMESSQVRADVSLIAPPHLSQSTRKTLPKKHSRIETFLFIA